MAKRVRISHPTRRRPSKLASSPFKRRKLSKRLEQAVRAIKDDDEFVSHITGLRDRYRQEHALRAASAQTAVRQATRTLHKHATALTHWLQQATADHTMERQALDRLGDSSLRPLSPQVLQWLIRVDTAVANSVITSSRSRTGDTSALLVATEGLRAIFEHHKLKLSTSGKASEPAESVRLLCAIAHEAGDEELQPEVAKAALRAHRPA